MKLLIGADIVPTIGNQDYFINGDIEYLLGDELKQIFESVDYRILNLETPLIVQNTPIAKWGPNLGAHVDTVNGLKSMKIDLLTLANNHILDHGQQGLDSTCNVLKENKIQYVGVGNNVKKASCPYIFTLKNKKIGVYACAETEFSIATEKTAGANPYDALESFTHVKRLKEACDIVIVLYHGGKEYYRYPSPDLKKICHKFAENGADIIVTQHSHCVGCMEKYLGATIVYGQGNFLFTKRSNEYWDNGLLLEVEIDNESTNVNYIPIKKIDNVIRIANEKEDAYILEDFFARSKEILDDNFVRENYMSFSKTLLIGYKRVFLGRISDNILYRIVNKLTSNKLTELIFGKKHMLAILNYIMCEAHRELLITALRAELNEGDINEKNCF